MNPSVTPSLAPGSLLGGKYRISRVLGQGGMGTVLLARHEELDQLFAIKVLTGDLATDPEAVTRFMREARAAAKLQSEHVVRVSDVGKFDGIGPYIVMEYLSGVDLAQRIAQGGRLPPREAVDHVLEAIDAIAEAHSRGIVHRDIKPSNLFLAERADGRTIVKVLDFGISKVDATMDAGALQHKLTSAGSVLGSPAYMSPEQLKNAREVDARADIWSLGVVLFELVSGVIPFEAETAGGVFTKVVSEDARPVRELCVEVPPALEAVIARCLRRNVDERWADVGELASALEPLGSGRAGNTVARVRKLSLSGGAVGAGGARPPGAAMAPTLAGPPPSSTPMAERPAAVAATHGAWTAGGRGSGRSRWGFVVGVFGIVLGVSLVGIALYVHSLGASRDAATSASKPPAASLDPSETASSEPPSAPATAIAPTPAPASSSAPSSSSSSSPPSPETSAPSARPPRRVPVRPLPRPTTPKPTGPSFLDHQR
jgi:serine/threonine protein kinase